MDELLTKCLLTDKEVQLAGQEYEDNGIDMSVNDYLFQTQLIKAIPIISEEAKKQVYHDIHTDLMSITCRDSYESMSKRIDQLLNKVQEKMLALQG